MPYTHDITQRPVASSLEQPLNPLPKAEEEEEDDAVVQAEVSVVFW